MKLNTASSWRVWMSRETLQREAVRATLAQAGIACEVQAAIRWGRSTYAPVSDSTYYVQRAAA